jgi:hypothetical protein
LNSSGSATKRDRSTPAPPAYSSGAATSSQQCKIPISDNQFYSLSILPRYMSDITPTGEAGAGSCVCETGKEQGTKLVGMFEVILTRRKRFGWRWQVCDQSGKKFADGFERTRPSAKYHGERALFFLLSQAHLRNRLATSSED